MALYCAGDIQGCGDAFERLLSVIGFSPSRDTIYLLGDLVNRGPASAAVLRRCMQMGDSVRALLGNHDLHLLAVSQGVRKPHRLDTVADILGAPDRLALLDWLRQRPLALHENGVLMVHAGVLPAWTAARARCWASTRMVLARWVRRVTEAWVRSQIGLQRPSRKLKQLFNQEQMT